MLSHENATRNSSTSPRNGILLVNTGSPQTPTNSGLRSFLREFLSDRRLIKWPRWLWLPLLHLLVLRIRPKRVAPKYKLIWTDQGSPLLAISNKIASKLELAVANQTRNAAFVRVGMRYGQPSIAMALNDLHNKGVDRIMVLPLFPQYSEVTTASAYDAVFDELRTWHTMPEIYTATGYHLQSGYIAALAESIETFFSTYEKPERLLFSYHGIPISYARAGDRYGDYCFETTSKVMQTLQRLDLDSATSFQSRFGPQQWLPPYTDELLKTWADDGVRRVAVICPGFSVDCLETLHEIAVEARQEFLQHGGEALYYIPALNDSSLHIHFLGQMLQPFLRWNDGLYENRMTMDFKETLNATPMPRA